VNGAGTGRERRSGRCGGDEDRAFRPARGPLGLSGRTGRAADQNGRSARDEGGRLRPVGWGPPSGIQRGWKEVRVVGWSVR